MKSEYAEIGAAVVVIAILAGLLLVIRRNRRLRLNLDQTDFHQRWAELQLFCGNQQTWPEAIINADKLLDQALKKRHFKGKTMGERLMSARGDLSDHDRTWRCHKLRKSLEHGEEIKLNRRDVKEALLGIRTALKDLGAL